MENKFAVGCKIFDPKSDDVKIISRYNKFFDSFETAEKFRNEFNQKIGHRASAIHFV